MWPRFLRDLVGREEKEENRKQAPSVGNTVVSFVWHAGFGYAFFHPFEADGNQCLHPVQPT